MTFTDKKSCPACLKDSFVDAGEKHNFLLKRCRVCNTIVAELDADSPHVAREIDDLYEHYYDSAEFQIHPATETSLQKIIDSFADFRQTGKLLDIGFGEGGLLKIAEKNNWQCYGTELSPKVLEYGQKKGWTVSKDALNDENFPKGGFDVVTMIEIIEHIPQPDFIIKTAFSMLRPNGLLFITTPNSDSINRRLLGADWSVLSPPEHITLLSSFGIKKLLERNNFTMRKIRTEGFNPAEIIGKLRSPSSSPQEKEISFSRNETAFALNEKFNGSSWRRAVKSSINRGLSFFKIGDGIKVWAIKQS